MGTEGFWRSAWALLYSQGYSPKEVALSGRQKTVSQFPKECCLLSFGPGNSTPSVVQFEQSQDYHLGVPFGPDNASS